MRRPLLLLALVLFAGQVALQGRSEAAVYFAQNSYLGRANLDGGMPLWPLPNGYFPALETGSGCGLAVDDQHIYWGNSNGGAVGRATIAGTAPDQAFVSGLSSPCGVEVNASHIYWSDLGTNMIGRAHLGGGSVEPSFIAGVDDPCGIAVDSAHVYWANRGRGSIGRASLDGGDVNQEFIAGLGFPCGVAVGGGYLFWGDQGLGSIGRAAVDGSGVEPAIVTGAGEPWEVAASPTHVYWADRRGTPADPTGGIGRAALDGSGASHDLIPGLHNPTGVALDSLLFTPPPPILRPSDFLHFGKLSHLGDGSVRLEVHVPARGDFQVLGPKIGWSIDKGNPPAWVGGTFRWKLKLWPGKGTKAAKRVRRQLRRDGRAPVVLRMAYQQEGRTALEATKRFAFKR